MGCHRALFVALALLVAGCSAPDDADSVTAVTDIIAIRGGTVLAGAGLEPVPEATLVIAGGVIRELGPDRTVQVPDAARTIDATGLTIAPGFIDAHVHIGFADPHEVAAGGITTVRDLAWPPAEIFPLVERSGAEGFDGPRIVAAGPMITAPGGYPTNAAWAPSGTGLEIGSVDEAGRAVAEIADRGATVVKIALNPPVGPTLPLDVLQAVVSAAHERDLKVTGHIYGLPELDKAIDAGVDELAHMLMGPERIPDETLAAMVAADMTIVPTLSIRDGDERSTAIDNLRRFVAAGGSVVYGTDLGNEGPRPGIDPTEVEAMAEAGMSARDIVASATVDAARWLGLSDTGVLAEGMRADVVGFRGDATRQIDALTDVAFVVAGGRQVER